MTYPPTELLPEDKREIVCNAMGDVMLDVEGYARTSTTIEEMRTGIMKAVGDYMRMICACDICQREEK